MNKKIFVLNDIVVKLIPSEFNGGYCTGCCFLDTQDNHCSVSTKDIQLNKYARVCTGTNSIFKHLIETFD